MRIGIVTAWMERGAGYVSQQYDRVLRQQGNEVYIYARGGESYPIGDFRWDNTRVTWGKKIPLHMPMAMDLADFKQWIVSHKLDMVFFNEQQWWDPVLLCKDMGIMAGAYVDYYTSETVPFFALYDFLICNTQRHYSVFRWHPQVTYIPWGTDLELYKPNRPGLVQSGTVTFFHSAGMSPERKGTEKVIQAFMAVTGPARLLIHSQVRLERFYPRLMADMARLKQTGRLVVREEVISAPGLYAQGDVYVYPSRLDGIGLTIAEALSSGLPIIVPDSPPMNEFASPHCSRVVKIDTLTKRGDGYYWPLVDIRLDALTAAMQQYVDNPEDVVAQKRAARVYAENKLDWSQNARVLTTTICGYRRLAEGENASVRAQVVAYERARSNWQTRLYRAAPWMFKPFAWLWPLIKMRYIS